MSSSSSLSPPTKRFKAGSTTAASQPQQTSLSAFFAPRHRGSSSSSSTTQVAAAAPATDDSSLSQKEDPPIPTTTEPIIPHAVPWQESKWRVYQNAVLYRNPNHPNSHPQRLNKVAAFDVDGTLVTWRTAGWPSKLTDYELWNTNVLRKLRHLYDAEGYQLVFISNQGAIRSAHTGKKATAVKSLMEWLMAAVGRPIGVVLSTDKKQGFHKPSLQLWHAAQHLLASDNHKETWSIAESLYVGDSVGDDNDPQGGVDLGLARNVSAWAGDNVTLRFATPDDFFGPSHAAQRSSVSGAVTVKPVPPHVQATRAALVSGNRKHSTSPPILLLLCGAQGSGKSTLATRLVQQSSSSTGTTTWKHFSQDTIRNGQPGRREQVEQAVQEALQAGHCVIVDRMHLDESQRQIFVNLAERVGNGTIPVHCIVLRPPTSLLAQRVTARTNHTVQGPRGAQMARSSAAKLVFPTYDEGFALISATASPTVGVDRLVQLYTSIVMDDGTKSSTSSSLMIPAGFALPAGTPRPQQKQSDSTSAQSLVATTASNVILPSILLGTMGLGRTMAADVVAQALLLGLDGVDTAPTYKNEDKLGPVLSDGPNQNAYVIVKVPKRATTAAEVKTELTTSLQNLQRAQVDLLLLHWPSLAPDALKEVWQAMEAAVDQGQAKALGVCNANVAALAGLLAQSRIPPAVLQMERHPLLPQWDVVDFCAQHDIQIQAHTPLGQGKDDLLQHEVVQKVAASYPDTSAAQVLLSWNVIQGVAVVPKASKPDHLQELTRPLPQLRSTDLQLLNEITERKRFVAPPFMYGTASFCWGKQMPK